MSSEPHPVRPRVRRRVAIAGITLAAFVLAGLGFWRQHEAPAHAAVSAQPQSIPVTTETATRRDVPIYLSGLGTVQASNTTAIHTQVDGKLQSVNFTEGQEVHRGDTLVQIDPRFYKAALDQATAKKAQDEAQLAGAQADLKRFQALAARNVETQQNLDHQVALVGQLTAAIDADEAAIESAQTQLDYTTIKAPTDGRVGIRQVDPGNIVHVGDATPIVVLTQTHPIAAVFTLPEANLDAVRAAMARGPVAVEAYDQNDSKRLAAGTLLLVDNQIDQTTSTIKLKANFLNADETLWPGEFVHIRLLADTRKDALTVSSAAVQRGPKGLYAWVVRPDGTAEQRPIDTGPTQGDVTILSNGLAAGEQVVTNGQYRLQPGSHVEAKSAAGSAPKGTPKSGVS